MQLHEVLLQFLHYGINRFVQNGGILTIIPPETIDNINAYNNMLSSLKINQIIKPLSYDLIINKFNLEHPIYKNVFNKKPKNNYYAESNKALYRSNPLIAGSDVNYAYGNSFGIVYDDVTTFSIFGELSVDINRNFNLGIKAEYYSYDTDEQAEAWNLPDFQGSLFMDYQIDEYWYTGINLFYIGERKAVLTQLNPFILIPPQTISLDSYFDANAHVGYRINDRWSAFVKANNIANQDYNRWLNFPVQGIQFLAGTTYKFDF